MTSVSWEKPEKPTNNRKIVKGFTRSLSLAFPLFFFSLLNKEYITGKTINVSRVEVINPPITTVANGRCTSAPAPVETAIGKKPKAAAEAVNKTARNLSWAPFIIRLSLFSIPFSRNSLKCSIRTIPFKTAIPNRAIKPTPAEILKGIPRIHNKRTPPTAAKGIAENIIKASLKVPKAKYNRIKIRTSAMGTAIFRREVALCRFSNCPP